MIDGSNVQAPLDAGSNDFGVRKFTAETSHAANAIPNSWSGKYVRALAVGGNVHFGFSISGSAEVDRAVTATAAGASAKVGDVLSNGIAEQFRIPRFGPGVTMYFVRESDTASTVVYLRLADTPGLAP